MDYETHKYHQHMDFPLWIDGRTAARRAPVLRAARTTARAAGDDTRTPQWLAGLHGSMGDGHTGGMEPATKALLSEGSPGLWVAKCPHLTHKVAPPQ